MFPTLHTALTDKKSEVGYGQFTINPDGLVQRTGELLPIKERQHMMTPSTVGLVRTDQVPISRQSAINGDYKDP